MINTKVLEVKDRLAKVECEGQKLALVFDSIIIATGYLANREAILGLDYPEDKIEYIGDSHQPGKVLNAVWDGYRKVLFSTMS